MTDTAIFVIGLVTSLVLGSGLVFSAYEIRKATPGAAEPREPVVVVAAAAGARRS